MNDRDVADYLLASPDFFATHAELLAAVRLANPHGKNAISLQERQMEMLREKNKQLERRLAELLRYGHENDSMANKFNQWTARVLCERDPHALPRAIASSLRQIFEVPHAALRLWGVAESYAVADFARHAGEEVRIFTNSLSVPYCGANSGFEAAQWLVEEESATQPPDIASLALLPLRDPRGGESASAFGLLVMGSPDARRFHEGMSTNFLTQLSALASAALSRLLAH